MPARLWEGGTHCFVGRVSFNRRIVSKAEAFWLTGDLNIIFPREGRAVRYAVGIAVDRSFPKPGWFRGAVKVRRHEAMGAAGINECQETSWSEELDGKEL